MTGLGVPAADPAPGEPRAITTIRRAMGAGRQSAITAQNSGSGVPERESSGRAWGREPGAARAFKMVPVAAGSVWRVTTESSQDEQEC